MPRKLFLTASAALLGVSTVLLQSAQAEVPLTSAEIREITNRVRLLPKNQSERDARLRDQMQPEDALSTARRSRAGLRFNDGSFARLGELTWFNFTPGTRNFRLRNGTVLLMIKPGNGRTRINTPNASAGVRGTALFVRYDEETKTTIVGALTNNPQGPMEVTDSRGRTQKLQAGQMAVVTPAGIRLFDFDMWKFYETSRMVRGLDVPAAPATTVVASPREGVPEVRQEMADALKTHTPPQGPQVIETPAIVKLTPSKTEFFEPSNASTIAQPTTSDNPNESKTPTEPAQKPQSTTPEVKDPKPRVVPEVTPSNPAVKDPEAPPSTSTPSPAPAKVPVAPAPSPTPAPAVPVTPAPSPTPAPVTPAPNPTPVEVPVTPAPTNPTPVAPAPTNATPVTPNPTPVTAPVTPRQQIEVTPPGRAVQENPPAQTPTAPTVTPAPVQAPVEQPAQPTPAPAVPVTPVPSPTPNPTPDVTTLSNTPGVNLAPALTPTVVPVDVPPASTPSTTAP